MGSMVIHALQVGPGILALSPLPGRGGNYADDLEHLREWQPALVVTLTTRAEMVREGVETLGADVQERGCRWVHLPIADFSPPDPEAEARWPELSKTIRAALRGGGRVLVHCMGGCGRSGMIALRLMVETGEAPDQAMARLRLVRPCAIETEAQMQWATTLRPPDFVHRDG